MAKVISNNSKTVYVLDMNKDEAQTLLDLLRSIAGHESESRRLYVRNIADSMQKLDWLKLIGKGGYDPKDIGEQELGLNPMLLDLSYEPLAQASLFTGNTAHMAVSLNLIEAQVILDLTQRCYGSSVYSRYKHIYSINCGLRSLGAYSNSYGLVLSLAPDVKGRVFFKNTNNDETSIVLKPAKVNTKSQWGYKSYFYKPIPVENSFAGNGGSFATLTINYERIEKEVVSQLAAKGVEIIKRSIDKS